MEFWWMGRLGGCETGLSSRLQWAEGLLALTWSEERFASLSGLVADGAGIALDRH